MEITKVVIITILLSFCLFAVYWRAYIRGQRAGFKRGAEQVLNEWKKTLAELEEKD